MKAFLTAVTAVVHEIAKPLQYTSEQETSFAEQVERSKDADSQQGRSI